MVDIVIVASSEAIVERGEEVIVGGVSEREAIDGEGVVFPD